MRLTDTKNKEEKMKKVLVSMVLLVTLALVIAGCGSQATPTTAPAPAPPQTTANVAPSPVASQSPSAKTPTPQYGGILRSIVSAGPVAAGYPPASNPMDTAGTLGVMEGLIGVDKLGEPTPRLATAWQLSQDGKTLTFTLRKGVKFHDGTDFNAAAVKWNFDMDIQAKLITSVSSVDIVDDYTVKFNLPQFNNAVFPQISDILFISPTAVQKNGTDWAKTNPVGTGPFKQTEFVRDVSITKMKFDGYWDKGLPYLDGMKVIVIPDSTTAKMSFQAGEADLITVSSDYKGAKELADKGYIIRSMPGMANFFVTDRGNQDSPYANLKVRQALEYIVDRKATTESVGMGYMGVLNQIAPDGWGGFNPDLPAATYDPAKAKQLLAEAGYPSGFKTKLMASQRFTIEALMTAIQGYLANVGIEATVDLMDLGRYMQTRKDGWQNGIMLAGTGLDPNLCQRIEADLGANNGLYSIDPRPAQFQPTLDQAKAARDIDTRNKALQQLMKVVSDDEFVTPLWYIPDIVAMQKNVNADIMLYHHIKWNPATAWISK
jgi:peptide/nickel transport system substrate-binding protein